MPSGHNFGGVGQIGRPLLRNKSGMGGLLRCPRTLRSRRRRLFAVTAFPVSKPSFCSACLAKICRAFYDWVKNSLVAARTQVMGVMGMRFGSTKIWMRDWLHETARIPLALEQPVVEPPLFCQFPACGGRRQNTRLSPAR